MKIASEIVSQFSVLTASHLEFRTFIFCDNPRNKNALLRHTIASRPKCRKFAKFRKNYLARFHFFLNSMILLRSLPLRKTDSCLSGRTITMHETLFVGFKKVGGQLFACNWSGSTQPIISLPN